MRLNGGKGKRYEMKVEFKAEGRKEHYCRARGAQKEEGQKKKKKKLW